MQETLDRLVIPVLQVAQERPAILERQETLDRLDRQATLERQETLVRLVKLDQPVILDRLD